MSLAHARRDLRLRDHAADMLADWREPPTPSTWDVIDAIRAKIADDDVPVWWRDRSLASIGLVECRTFGRGRHVRDWLE